MTSIFPNTAAGGLIVRDPETGAQIEQPEVENVSVPAQLNINCDMLALPSLCGSQVAPEQINAIVSELINFYIAMAPGREWDCDALDNMAEAFEEFVANLGSSGGGGTTCQLTIGNAGEVGDAYVLFCDGNSLQKWTIQGEDGMVEFFLDLICQAPTSDILDTDFIVYCRDGQIGKGSAGLLNLYAGPWVQNRAYSVKNMVQKDNKLYSPNAPIPTGTPFTEGLTGATWREINQATFPPYNPADEYSKDAIISRAGNFYAANEDIPANTPFQVGDSGATWRELDLTNISILDFSAQKSYKKYNVVKTENGLYRATQDIPAGAFDPTRWEMIAYNDRSLYRGNYDATKAYQWQDMVSNSGKLFAANGPIPANTPFSVGTGAQQWSRVSDNAIEFDSQKDYPNNEFATHLGSLFVANGPVPKGGDAPSYNIGTAPGTWRLFSSPIKIADYNPNGSYVQNELFLRNSPSYPAEKQLWGAGPGPWPAAFDPTANTLFGERNKFRGRWNVNETYKRGDLVLVAAGADQGIMFEANSDIASGTAFAVGTTNGTFTRLTPIAGNSIKIFNQSQAYNTGDIVLTKWGMYIANANIPANTPFEDGATRFEPYNTGRSPVITIPGAGNAVRNHRNATLIFTASTGTVGYTFGADVGFDVGDTIFGMSRTAQIIINASAQNEVRSVEGLTLRNVPNASFVLRCIGKTGSVCEWLLTGDLQPIE